MIHGFLEPQDTIENGAERMVADKANLQKVCDEIDCGVAVADEVKFCKRLGARGDTTRPLLVGFKDTGSRSKILDNAHKLAEKGPTWQEISIVLDLTPMQRKEEDKLRVEVTTKNKELSEDEAKNWIWKVVGRRGERRMIKTAREEEQERGGEVEEGEGVAGSGSETSTTTSISS